MAKENKVRFIWVAITLSCFISSVSIAQKFVFKTASDDSEVYVKNEKVGSGKEVTYNLQKPRDIIQVKVVRPGYKTEYNTAVTSEKVLEFKNTRKLATSKDRFHSIAIKNLSAKELAKKNYRLLMYRYSPFKKGEFKELLADDCIDKMDVAGVDFDLEGSFINAMVATGYVDTLQSLLSVNGVSNFMDVNIYNLKFYLIHDGGAACKDLSIAVEVSVTYVMKDKFNNIKMDANVVSVSSIFSMNEYDWVASDFSKRHDLLNLCVQDAFEKGLLDKLNEESSAEFFKDTEPLRAEVMPPLKLVCSSFVKDTKSAMEATVSIKTEKGFGSACVVSNDGYIVTSYHVVAGIDDSLVNVNLGKGKTVKGRIVRTSFLADLVLIKIDHKFPFAFKLQKNTELELMDDVFAIGTPVSLDLNQTLTRGIVSALRKTSDGMGIIQTDVKVSPGSSGGPLLKDSNVLVGMVSSKLSGDELEGLGFCLSVADMIKYLNLVDN